MTHSTPEELELARIKKGAGGWNTTFPTDFGIAEAFGLDAIKDTFNRAFKEWGDNIIYLAELALIVGNQTWVWYSKIDKDPAARAISEFYAEALYICNDKAYGKLNDDGSEEPSEFNEAEKEYYFRLTD